MSVGHLIRLPGTSELCLVAHRLVPYVCADSEKKIDLEKTKELEKLEGKYWPLNVIELQMSLFFPAPLPVCKSET